MMEQSFSLLPFPDPNIPEIKIAGVVSRRENKLAILYSLTGKSEVILFPPSNHQPERKAELWSATCFEFFLAIPDQPQYWEFNLSPSGDWNVYRMDAYRRIGFREEALISQLPFTVQYGMERITIDAIVDLHPIIPKEQSIQAGVASVIQTKDGHQTYWALTHPIPQADFHLRKSFILAL